MTQTEDPQPSNSTLSEFVRGATRPSLAALACTVVVAGAIAAFGLSAFRPEIMIGEWGAYFPENARDDYAFMSRDVMRIRRAPPAPLAVAVLGASGVEEALSSIEEMREEVATRTDLRPAVHNLTTKNLSLPEMASILEQVGPDFDGVAVLGVGVRSVTLRDKRFAQLMSRPRLAFTSEIVDEEARFAGVPVPWRSGNYLYDNRHFFSLRAEIFARNLWRGPPVRSTHPFISDEKIDGRPRRVMVSKIERLFQRYESLADANFERLGRLVDRLERYSNVSIVILEAPINTDWVTESKFGDVYAEHLRRAREFTAARGIPYWDLMAEAHVTPDDFYDWCHMRHADAQDRYTRVLSRRIAEALERHVGRESSV